MPTHHFVTEGQTAFVKMVNGKFSFAIIKSCGNPVVAKPKLNPTAVCKNLDAVVSNRTRVKFTAQATVKDGAKVTGYTYVVKDASGKTVLNTTKNTSSTSNSFEHTFSTPGKYTAQVTAKTSVGNKTATACKDSFEIKKEEPKPVATCKMLDTVEVDRTNFKFNAQATADGGATISRYTYEVLNSDGQVIDTLTENSTSKSSSVNYTQETVGSYKVRVTVTTSVGNKTAASCEDEFEVKEKPEEPVAECELLTVSPISRTKFKLDAEASTDGGATISGYTFVVINSEDDVVFNETVDTTGKEASETAEITTPGEYIAKVTVHTSLGDVGGERCEAPLEVTEEEKPEEELVKRCDVKEQKTVKITKEQAEDTKRYKPVGDEACEDQEQPEVLAKTGPGAIIGAGMGISSITAAGYYWTQSRRNLLDQLLKR
jgi:PKD repeat protein